MPAATTPDKKRRIAKLAKQGLSQTAIGKAVGLHQTTVGDILAQLQASQATIQDFDQVIGEAFSVPLAYLTDVELKLLKYFNDEAVLANLPDNAKINLLQKVAINKGINYEKKRLHEGKSTGNISHRVLLEQTCQDEWTTKGKAREVSGDDEKPQ